MKIVVADTLHASGLDGLRALGAELVIDPHLEGPALAEACAGAQVLVVRSTKVPASVIQATGDLILIIRAGAGLNTIDLEAAASRGIFVSNCPGKNAAAVAELALGLLIALDRRIPDNVSEFRSGRWAKARFSQAAGLAGKTLGIVGLGPIGQEVLRRARAFGMRTIGWSRSLTERRAEELGVERCDTLEALFAESDAVSLHLALVPETRGIIGAHLLGLLRRGALFINTARSGLVDEAALLEAIEAQDLRVGLDVFDGEPAGKEGEVQSALTAHPGVYVTHHIGASTEQAQAAVAEEVVRVVRGFQETGLPPNCQNLCTRSPATHQLAIRHRDEVGVLAALLELVSEAGLNVEEMENLIFEGAQAACCYLRVASEPSITLLSSLRAHAKVFGVALQELG